jgi:hypothetical protein
MKPRHVLPVCSLSFCLSLGAVVPAMAQVETPFSFRIVGEGGGDAFGWSVAPAGDVNGDGHADVLVGAPSNDTFAGFSGRAYLFLGPFNGGDLLAADADAIVTPEAFGDNLGVAVAAGDLDGDGAGDLVIGARSNDGNGIQAGRVYVFFGPVTQTGTVPARQADLVISGDEFDEIGWAIAAGSDLNGDGVDDLAIGATFAGAFFAEGQTTVFFGPLAPGRLTVADADVVITGIVFAENFGEALATGADLSGDGQPDLVVGAPRAPINGEGPGRAYVFFAPLLPGSFLAFDADATLEGADVSDDFGGAVATGDLDGDGTADLAVGANELFREGGGRAYVFDGPLDPGFHLASDADALFLGEAEADLFGASVAAADADGDGVDDLLVGAWDNAGGGVRSGRAYLFYGPLGGTGSAADADRFFTGVGGDEVGLSSAPAGDLDADGIEDLLIGAPGFFDEQPGYAGVYLGEARAAAIAPVDPPVTIPPGGGVLRYRVTLANPTAQPMTVEAWVTATLPDGSPFGPIEGPRTVALAPGQTVGPVPFAQRVPGAAPAGTYTATLNVGDFPGTVTASDSFTFEKAPGAAGGAAASAVEAAATAYPNPFAGRTTIRFTTVAATTARLVVYDVLGREVARLLDGPVEAGAHAAVLDGAALPAGVYVWLLEVGGRVEAGRLTLLR